MSAFRALMQRLADTVGARAVTRLSKDSPGWQYRIYTDDENEPACEFGYGRGHDVVRIDIHEFDGDVEFAETSNAPEVQEFIVQAELLGVA